MSMVATISIFNFTWPQLPKYILHLGHLLHLHLNFYSCNAFNLIQDLWELVHTIYLLASLVSARWTIKLFRLTTSSGEIVVVEIRFYFWKISIGVIFEIEVLPIGKIRMAKNCIFIKELYNVVDLPGKSSVGISSSHHQSLLSCWRKDRSKGFSPSLSNDGEKWKWASSLFLAKTLFSLNLKESVPRGQQWYKDQVFSFPSAFSNGSKFGNSQWRKVKQMQLCLFWGR